MPLSQVCSQRWHKYGMACTDCNYVLYKREIAANTCPRCHAVLFSQGQFVHERAPSSGTKSHNQMLASHAIIKPRKSLEQGAGEADTSRVPTSAAASTCCTSCGSGTTFNHWLVATNGSKYVHGCVPACAAPLHVSVEGIA